MTRHIKPQALPHSIEAERAVLGGILVDPAMAPDVLDILQPGDFYQEKHGAFYRLLVGMLDRHEPIELTSVIEKIISQPCGGESFGGFSYVAALGDNVPSTCNLDYYARIICEKAKQRDVLTLTGNVRARLYGGELSAQQAVEELMELTGEVSQGAQSAPISMVLGTVADDIDAEFAGLKNVYIPTSIAILDNAPDFGGITTEGMTYIIGASGMGKTSLLNRYGLGMSSLGYRVCLYGTETGKKRRTRDLQFSLAAVDGRKWATMTAAKAELLKIRGDTRRLDSWLVPARDRLKAAAIQIDRLPIIVYNSGHTVEQLASSVRRYHRQGRCDILIADYLQDFVYSPGIPNQKTAQVSHASKTLKDLAASLAIPVLVGAQRQGEMELNNAIAKSTDRTFAAIAGALVPSQVQWCSGAYQDAEEVYGMYRRDYYADRHPELDHLLPGDVGRIQLHAKKRRNGPMNVWSVAFDGPSKWCGARPDYLAIPRSRR